ncbi:hypothetical protein DNHGIG_32220 [Collibacillus ludicampi]|uniref:SAF domain-containing protein n=1 Tax=Collibacillus ludicampi TaxID=2771369 RepID=A0AAV4LIS2_9BACL|nr:SAF domain-containing protein [Collibacillus ludicampi]GIM47673.1 hypothetical protein DNHGIG_32220 [Collibacillus ludicampi]
MRTDRSLAKGAMWLGLLVGIGLVIGWIAQTTIQKATHMVPVWVAANKIRVDQKIQPSDLRKELRPEGGVPGDAIKDPQEVVGKYTATTILPGQVIEKQAVADATTMREMVRQYGLNYVGMALQLDSQDMPIDQIHPGDMVAFLGTFNEGAKVVTTNLVASHVPVISVSEAEKKIIVAVPLEKSKELARDKAAGKISVVLDPQAFQQESYEGQSSGQMPTPKTTDQVSSQAPGQTSSQAPTGQTN